MQQRRPLQAGGPGLYSAEERQRRDASRWTLVQGVLAPVQFLVFLVSLVLVVRYLATGEGLTAATALGRGQDPGALRHHDHRLASGRRWSSAATCSPAAFFWEDVFSMLVLALHTAYLLALLTGTLDAARADAAGAGGLRHLRRQRRAVPAQAARGAAGPAAPRPAPRHWRREPPPVAASRDAAAADAPGAARARPARGVLRPDRNHLAAPQDPGRLLPRRRLAHLRPPDPVRRRRDDLRRAALRHRDHRRARPRRAWPTPTTNSTAWSRACSSAAPTSGCCSWSAPARPR